MQIDINRSHIIKQHLTSDRFRLFNICCSSSVEDGRGTNKLSPIQNVKDLPKDWNQTEV